MLPLLTAAQIRQADAHTMAKQSITSVELMERASQAFVNSFTRKFYDKELVVSIYCGTGNNGGDGLAIARLLFEQGYMQINVKVLRFSEKESIDFTENFRRLNKVPFMLTEIKPNGALPVETSDIIIDAMLGSGLNKPLTGNYKKIVEYLNGLQKTVISVDVPTGFYTDGEIDKAGTVLQSDLVITFQQPKINFLLPESGPYLNRWEVVHIGLDENFIAGLESPYQWIEEGDIKVMLKPRTRFSHKGTYGHALLIAGQDKTMGAALLCSSACVYAGAGLTTACIPESGLTALNSYQAEVMAIIRGKEKLPELDAYSVVAIGPGLGKGNEELLLLRYLLDHYKKPVVVDADALNLLAVNSELLGKLPAGSILTPHVKEFDRLFGEHNSWWQRLQTLRHKAKELKINILLKNAYTIIATPDGKLYFNSTSNAAMAVGGMGDVLTGIITALVSQKYSSTEACILGVYLHGKAGDELALPNCLQVVLPGQVAARVPATIARML